jgi:hypothetical protein
MLRFITTCGNRGKAVGKKFAKNLLDFTKKTRPPDQAGFPAPRETARSPQILGYHANPERHGKKSTEETSMNRTRVYWGILTLLLATLLTPTLRVSAAPLQNGAAAEAKDDPFVVEYYYKVKWGHAEEFLTLFKKNHYPVLKKEMELGRILRVSVISPRLHGTEDGRWDYRVTIVFKSAAIANDNFDSEALARQLYPDQETFKKEEQRRFEILDAHWDLPIKDVQLDKR